MIYPEPFILDKTAELECRLLEGCLYQKYGAVERDEMRARVVASPEYYEANACGYVIGPHRNSVEEAAADLELLLDYCVPHVGRPEFPIALIAAYRLI